MVEVAAGTYPSQSIRAVAGRTAPNVVFRPVSGARVTLGGLSFGAGNDPALGPDYVTVEGMATTYKGSSPGAGNQQGIHVGPGSSYVELVNMDAGSISSYFADNLTVRGGDYGPCDAVTGNTSAATTSRTSVNERPDRRRLLPRPRIRPVRASDCTGSACTSTAVGTSRIRANSRFERCAIFDLFVTICGPDAGADRSSRT